MSNRWFTKEDVLKDLAEVSGTRVVNIEDKFAVRGEQPPPVNIHEEDEEDFMEMYGFTSNGKNSHMDDTHDPDLNGIKHMLKMVNDYYNDATCNDDEHIKELKESANKVVIISKLNPHVPEFIPRSSSNNVSLVKEIKDSCVPSNDKPSELSDKEAQSNILADKVIVSKENDVLKTQRHVELNYNVDIDVSKKIDISKLRPEDIDDLKIKLKLKIKDTAMANCLKKKRERNLAITSLLKLYSGIPDTQNDIGTIKLKTPRDFETVLEQEADIKMSESLPNEQPKDIEEASYLKLSINNITISDGSNVSEKTTSEPKLFASDTNIAAGENFSKNTTTDNKLSRSISNNDCSKVSKKTTSKQESRETLSSGEERQCLSPEIIESVNKVNRWLEGPEEKKLKSRAVHLGPVTFKRKGSSSVSPSVDTSSVIDNVERSPSKETTDSYVPSSYAEELSKKYQKQSATKRAQTEDIWTKLQRELKEKDAVIRQKLSSPQQQD